MLTATPMSTTGCVMRRSSATAAVSASVTATGRVSARRTDAHVAERHGSSGPTPIRKISASISGPFTRLKNGSPTVMVVPVANSEMSGKTTPHSVTNAMPSSSRLFTRKAVSRERADSRFEALRSAVIR